LLSMSFAHAYNDQNNQQGGGPDICPVRASVSGQMERGQLELDLCRNWYYWWGCW
jgi:hypothetical protein